MIRITDQYFWNLVFTFFFAVLVVMGVIILETESRISLTELTLVDYVIITLASWRVIRLFVYDAVTRWFREQFYDVQKSALGTELVKPKVGPRRTLADLLSCPWCFGIWATAMVMFFYLLTPYAIYPTVFLALSAVASSLQIIMNLIGHQAEIKKKENESN